MSRESLHEALERLHAELQGSPKLDEDSRRLLTEVAADISRLRPAAGAGGGATAGAAAAGATEAAHARRLESLAARFGAEHPELAARLRGIADALVRVGL